MVGIMEFYNTNNDFKTYVDKYCATHRTLPENAVKTLLVQEVYKMYKASSKGDTNEPKTQLTQHHQVCGC